MKANLAMILKMEKATNSILMAPFMTASLKTEWKTGRENTNGKMGKSTMDNGKITWSMGAVFGKEKVPPTSDNGITELFLASEFWLMKKGKGMKDSS